MRESALEKKLIQAVKQLGGFSYKFVSPTNRGVADRIVCFPRGYICFVELKSEQGKLSPLQEVFKNDMLKLEQCYYLIQSLTDLEYFVSYWHNKLDIANLTRANELL
jgi:hypothetical protein